MYCLLKYDSYLRFLPTRVRISDRQSFIDVYDARVKGLNPHELAHRWMKDLGTRPDMSIKVG